MYSGAIPWLYWKKTDETHIPLCPVRIGKTGPGLAIPWDQPEGDFIYILASLQQNNFANCFMQIVSKPQNNFANCFMQIVSKPQNNFANCFKTAEQFCKSEKV